MNAIKIADADILPTDLFITAALLNRPERAPNLQAEVAAFCELSQILADNPTAALRRFLDIALRLCNAGTAVLSLLRPNGSGQTAFHWEAISGALASHEGGEMPRDFSPCGLCLDAGTTILVSQPERAFTYLSGVQPAVVESLIVPLYDTARRPLGTIWIAHHDSTSCFCVNDVRVVEQLAIQLVLALKLLEESRAHRDASTLLESHKVAQRSVAHDLAEERSRRERAEASESGIRQAMMFKDAVIQEVHHRVKNTIQIAASVLSLQARATQSAEVRAALQDGYGRLHLLAKVHELLYASAESTQEILMPTLLKAMGEALRQSFVEMSARVRLQVTSDAIVLSPDDAIPMALLANEAITNAYKHAFADGSSGEIAINLSCEPENALTLQITDNGIGMHLNGDESRLGLKLIRSFAAQLQGTLTLAEPVGATGTAVTLTIHRGAKRGHELDRGESDVASSMPALYPGRVAHSDVRGAAPRALVT